MPYILTTTNQPIPAEKREHIKTQLGQYAALIGKPESYLMVDFCENSPLYFAGTAEPAAIVAVELLGSSGAEAYGKFSAQVTALLAEQLAISPARIFMRYNEHTHWALGGRML